MLQYRRSLFAVCSLTLLFLFVFGNGTVVFAYPIEYDFSLQIMSVSMQPTLEINDIIYIKNVTGLSEIYASPVNGDIIVFRYPYLPQQLIIHRAIEKYQQDSVWYFVTKGDNNPVADSPVSEDYVVGKVVALVRVLQVNSHNVSVFSNSAFVDFHLNSTINALEFNVTMLLTQSAPNSFVNVTIPSGIVTGQLDVLVDGFSVNFEHSTNTTHHFVWFELEKTSYISDIVLPEFPSFLILPLFMIAILLAVAVYKRKRII